MAQWTFEPGHTAAEFCVRHMMVTFVRGAFKNVEGKLDFDPDKPETLSVDVQIRAENLWSGESSRDGHLKASDFLDVENHPKITFKGNDVVVRGKHEYTLTGDLTLRGVTKKVSLDVQYLGQWATPWWEDGVDKGPKMRAGFVATTSINRRDFGISWNADMPEGGRVVGDIVDITLDAEAVLDS